MAERIVSPGVFTREKDLSFLPAGVAQIGAAIIGPTLKGPSFVPTVVRNREEFIQLFGGFSTDYYTPYAVEEYLRGANGGSVTVVRVGYIGGYTADCVNLVVSQSGAGAPPKMVAATFAPSKLNNSGLGTISGSITGVPSASGATLNLHGVNVTASFAGSTIEGQSTTLFSEIVGNESEAPKIAATASSAYLYKHFRSSVSEAVTAGTIAGNSVISFETHTGGLDFEGGVESVNSNTYEVSITGNKDSAPARTPMILDQNNSDLFRIYARVDGEGGNDLYVIIKNIKVPTNNNSSPEYAQFDLEVRMMNRGDLSTGDLEQFSALNLDPASPNYLPKVIGDQFEKVTNAGEVVTHGDFVNQSKFIRIGDYNESTFLGNKVLQPMGYGLLRSPIKSTAAVPSASVSTAQVNKQGGYDESIPYGWKVDSNNYDKSALYTNAEYMSSIPHGSGDIGGSAFSLLNMKGFGNTDQGAEKKTEFGTSFKSGSEDITVNTAFQQLKFAVPMQFGFGGFNPGVSKNTAGEITATNVMGFDCSASTKSGSIAYKRAINAVSNPDEIDINMLVIPGIMHSLHPSVTNHAIDKVESRADCFYVMDSAKWGDNVQQAVSGVQTLDTNYAATYYPWVKMDDPDTNQGVWVPPSVVIPGVMAFTDRVAHEWFAPAGLNRGGLTSVRVPKKKLTHLERDTLYEGRVNPIATFPGQGVVVFGQKTLQAKPSALDRINVRRLLIRLKKFIASSSRFLVFEQNDSSTRARFLNIVNPFLESVQANSGLSAFKVVMDDSNNTPDVIDRNQMVGQIFIQPTRTAEFIVLDFSVLPTGAAFPE